MKTRLILLFAAFVLAAACTASAQGASADVSSYKIGIVDLQLIADSYDAHSKEVAALKVEVDTQNAELETEDAALKDELKAYADRRDGLSEDERDEEEAVLERKALAFDNKLRAANAELDRKKRRLKDALIKDIVEAVTKIGEEENYHLILEADAETRTGVLFYAQAINITPRVIELLNKKKAASAPAGAGQNR